LFSSEGETRRHNNQPADNLNPGKVRFYSPDLSSF